MSANTQVLLNSLDVIQQAEYLEVSSTLILYETENNCKNIQMPLKDAIKVLLQKTVLDNAKVIMAFIHSFCHEGVLSVNRIIYIICVL